MRGYLDLTNPPDRLAPWGIFVLRIVWGFAFFMHGYQKLFMLGVAGVSSFFTQIGVPLPGLAAPAVSVLELVGGLLLLVGLGTRWVAVLLALDMLGAMVLAHLPYGFYGPNGFELPLLFLGGLAAVFCCGPGALALDRALFSARRAAPAAAWSGEDRRKRAAPPV